MDVILPRAALSPPKWVGHHAAPVGLRTVTARMGLNGHSPPGGDVAPESEHGNRRPRLTWADTDAALDDAAFRRGEVTGPDAPGPCPTPARRNQLPPSNLPPLRHQPPAVHRRTIERSAAPSPPGATEAPTVRSGPRFPWTAQVGAPAARTSSSSSSTAWPCPCVRRCGMNSAMTAPTASAEAATRWASSRPLTNVATDS
jgi:hypothetical protein